MSDVILILTTIPADASGEDLARSLVAEHLAACVNVGAPMASIYQWRGNVEYAQERQLVIKTTADRTEAVRRRVKDVHPYEMPEFLIVPAIGGSEDYLAWVVSSTRSEPEPQAD